MQTETKCPHCGYNKFQKTTLQSCSAVPPFFRCARCEKFQWPKVVEVLIPLHNFVVINADKYFMSHLQCFNCKKEIKEFDPESLPEGWSTVEVEYEDPEGNPMWWMHALCGECQDVRITA